MGSNPTPRTNTMPWRNLQKRMNYREQQRELVRRAKDRPCADCGVKYPYYIMEFDHRPEEIKKFGVNKGPGRHGTQKILDEIAKCDVVCANCHRKRSHQRGDCIVEY